MGVGGCAVNHHLAFSYPGIRINSSFAAQRVEAAQAAATDAVQPLWGSTVYLLVHLSL